MRLRIALLISALLIAALLAYYFYSKAHPLQDGIRVSVPGMLHEGDAEFDNYRSFVKILHAKAELAVNFRGDRIAVVSGSVLNQGEKRLDAVELKISLFDNEGKVLREETRTPLRPDIGLKQPLSSLEKRSFIIWMESIPLIWDPSKVNIELTGSRFAQ